MKGKEDLPLSERTVLRLRCPELEERRGDRVLLVWGELARWMVVDDELRALLGLFDGKRTLEKVLALHARRRGRDPAGVRREAGALLPGLVERQVLTRRVAPAAGAAEAVSIANVTVNLTNRCNLRCTFCYNDPGKTGAPELGVERLMDAVEQGREIFAPEASFIVLGGEPTLDPERLFHALDRAERIFEPAPLLSTNGTLLSDELVARLQGRRVEVQVSLDAPGAGDHDAVRGRGVFARAVQGVERLVAAGVSTLLSMVFTRASAGQVEAYLDLAARLGVREARFIPMRLMGRGMEQRALLPDLHVFFEELLEVMARRPELRPLLQRDYFSILATVCRHSSPRSGCGIGRKVVFIDADGTVYPCPNHRLPAMACGNLAQERLADMVLHSAVMREVRGAYVVHGYPGCRRCPFRLWCAGDCRGEALAATGDPLAPSPHCEELKRIFLRMLWLYADGEDPLGGRGEQGRDLRDIYS